ncbi:MAG: hypothetical protein R6V35_03540 [Candidatus Nanohaloarchaea archaeon]
MSTEKQSTQLDNSYDLGAEDYENLAYWGEAILGREIGDDGRTRYDEIAEFEGIERDFADLEPALMHTVFYDFMRGLYDEKLDLERPTESHVTVEEVHGVLESLNEEPDNQVRFEEMKYVPEGFEPVNERVRRAIIEKVDELGREIQGLRPSKGVLSGGDRIFLESDEWEATGRMSLMEDSY